MNNSPYSKGSFRMSTNASNANKINNRYKPPKLTQVQKNFGAFRPVKGFRRFGKGIIADTGEDPNRAYIEFLNKSQHLIYKNLKFVTFLAKKYF